MSFTFTTAGESHGPQLTILVQGIPAGLHLNRDAINQDLRRRQHGYGRGGRMKIEWDEVQITVGVRGGETLGSPIAITIVNRDFENWQPAMDPWEVDEKEAIRDESTPQDPGMSISPAG
jgi:chorismate synthase